MASNRGSLGLNRPSGLQGQVLMALPNHLKRQADLFIQDNLKETADQKKLSLDDQVHSKNDRHVSYQDIF